MRPLLAQTPGTAATQQWQARQAQQQSPPAEISETEWDRGLRADPARHQHRASHPYRSTALYSDAIR